MKRLYEVWVRVGDKAGPVKPKDEQPLETFGEAVALAREFVPQAHEVLIIERRVAQRLQGDLPVEEVGGE
jgi:hypothetical protein